MNRGIILITGGDGNISEQIITKYLSQGEKVIAVDIHTKSKYSQFYENENYEYYQVDVTKIEDLQGLYQKIEQKYGRLTHIISGAGRPMETEMEELTNIDFEDVNRSIQLNLTSHIQVTKIFLPLLEKEEITNKSIILISSVNALKTFNLPIYSAAKAGIYGFMHAMTKELGKKNIRINTISPGTVPTKADLASGDQFYNYRYKNMLALSDFTKPEDIADASFSLTHIMKAVTGQNMVVDSGQIS